MIKSAGKLKEFIDEECESEVTEMTAKSTKPVWRFIAIK
jgi:hypothetical protein